MEYIPDGMSKAQWEAIKRKEQEANKGKNLGAVGITKFKSRSFEAFQKSGGKNLFPVTPDTPLEKRPYMMRPGGMPDGSDLKAKGLKPQAQATPSKIVDIDAKYDKLAKEGKLASAPWAANLPWTNAAASSYKPPRAEGKVAPKSESPVKGKVGATTAGKVTKPVSASKDVDEAPKKKGFFGLF
jgi:hypothetical protein